MDEHWHNPCFVFENPWLIASLKYIGDIISPTWEKNRKKTRASPCIDFVKKRFHWHVKHASTRPAWRAEASWKFLVAWTRLYESLRRSVSPLVGLSVCPAFTFLAFCKRFSHHRSCPIARDCCCHVLSWRKETRHVFHLIAHQPVKQFLKIDGRGKVQTHSFSLPQTPTFQDYTFENDSWKKKLCKYKQWEKKSA